MPKVKEMLLSELISHLKTPDLDWEDEKTKLKDRMKLPVKFAIGEDGPELGLLSVYYVGRGAKRRIMVDIG
jgi:hypothetical protein